MLTRFQGFCTWFYFELLLSTTLWKSRSLLSLFGRWSNWSLERLSKFPIVTQLRNHETKIQLRSDHRLWMFYLHHWAGPVTCDWLHWWVLQSFSVLVSSIIKKNPNTLPCKILWQLKCCWIGICFIVLKGFWEDLYILHWKEPALMFVWLSYAPGKGRKVEKCIIGCSFHYCRPVSMPSTFHDCFVMLPDKIQAVVPH